MEIQSNETKKEKEQQQIHKQEYSVLSDIAIRRELKAGNIHISNFNERQLGNCSYDVRLGNYFYREHKNDVDRWKSTSPDDTHTENLVYIPWNEDHVVSVWRPGQTLSPREFVAKYSLGETDANYILELGSGSQLIDIGPGETILGHTDEFIGGKNSVTMMIKARSTIGRNFLEVCKCAGWGDIGYTNRLTLEITNNSRYHTIPLVVGHRIAQVVFCKTDGTRQRYSLEGKYQSEETELERNWSPLDMLPRQFKDKEFEDVVRTCGYRSGRYISSFDRRGSPYRSRW